MINRTIKSVTVNRRFALEHQKPYALTVSPPLCSNTLHFYRRSYFISLDRPTSQTRSVLLVILSSFTYDSQAHPITGPRWLIKKPAHLLHDSSALVTGNLGDIPIIFVIPAVTVKLDSSPSPVFRRFTELSDAKMDLVPNEELAHRDAYTMAGQEVADVSSRDLYTTLAQKLGGYFPSTETTPATQLRKWSDEDIRHISELLHSLSPKWSKFPRLYIVLRTIGHLHALDALIDLGITDFWFPFSVKSMPSCVNPSVRREFLESQWIVLTRAADLEKGHQGMHQYFDQGDSLPFEVRGILGRGTYGVVDRVWSPVSRAEYARKRIPRGSLSHRVQENMDAFTNELQVLKRVNHYHIVELVGSYTDSAFVGLIFSPVADANLRQFLSSASNSPQRMDLLRSFFGCLSTALAYLHGMKIRHKDIKPENILVKGQTVLITDFGLALDWDEAGESTTQDTRPLKTPRYSAPEMLTDAPRNSSSDIWSLGCVFMEMTTVLKGKTVEGLNAFLTECGSGSKIFAENQNAVKTWMVVLMTARGSVGDNSPIGWIEQMLKEKSEVRPTAMTLANTIISSKTSSGVFFGSCCKLHGENTSTGERAIGMISSQPKDTENSKESSISGPMSDKRLVVGLQNEGVPLDTSRLDLTALAMTSEPPSKASLFAAIKVGDAERVKALIERGVDVESKDIYGQTALSKAVLQKNGEVVSVLLECGADVNGRDSKGYTALHRAAQDEAEGMVELLIQKGVDVNAVTNDQLTALHMVAGRKKPTCAKLLINAGIDLNAQSEQGLTALFHATRYGDEETTRHMLERNANPNIKGLYERQAIHLAAEYGHYGVVALLLDHGADVNCKDEQQDTPLTLAATFGHGAVTRFLIERGANVDCFLTGGRSVLHEASKNGHKEVVRVLINSGVAINSGDNEGVTPLTFAAAQGHIECVQMLLDGGAEVDCRSNEGSTALLHAAQEGRREAVKLLIENGADVNTRNVQGATPLHTAAQSGHIETAKVVLKYGADPNALTVQGWSATDLAESEGHEELVNLLLNAQRPKVRDVQYFPPILTQLLLSHVQLRTQKECNQ